MHLIDTTKHYGFFKPMAATRALQSAMMVLKPGQASGETSENEHPDSEQWLLVISGEGHASVAGRSVELQEGSLLVIEHAESHRIVNTGKTQLVTINFYCPPAYTKSGELRG